jgi:NAD(P)-dependent dehydrogenase (short-subunit alcohol dehydrogenase family)
LEKQKKKKMVSLSTVQTSNARISAAIPPTTTPVAVFIGATSGIGRASLLQFAQHTAQNKPRIYFVGRSQAAADEILQHLRHIKPDDGANGGGGGGGGAAEYVFIQADVSLLSQVDEVCKQIKEKESVVNVLFLSQGTLDMTTGIALTCFVLFYT